MSQVFAAKNPDDGSIGVRVFRDENAADFVHTLPFGSLIVIEDGAAETEQRIKAEVRMNVASAPIPGWVNKNVLGPPLPPEQIGGLVNPFQIDLFVLQCASAELSSTTGGTDAPGPPFSTGPGVSTRCGCANPVSRAGRPPPNPARQTAPCQ